MVRPSTEAINAAEFVRQRVKRRLKALQMHVDGHPWVAIAEVCETTPSAAKRLVQEGIQLCEQMGFSLDLEP